MFSSLRYCSAGFIACAAAAVVLASTYRIAEAQIHIIDSSFYTEADPVIENTTSLLKRSKCLSREAKDELLLRLNRAFSQLEAGKSNFRLAYKDGSNNVDKYREIWNLADGRSRSLRYLMSKVFFFPRCKRIQTDFDKELMERFRTGIRPEMEERVEIGGSGRTWTGPYFGFETLENLGRVRSTETLAGTGAVNNQFSDSGDPLGVGIVAGYNFKPWNNNVVIGPYASFDYLNQTINHNFAGGQSLGTTTHWFINAGVKAGVVTGPGFNLYGVAGAAFLNHDLNVNFATAAQSNVTTPGFTLGLGGEYQPPPWQLAGHPVSLFAQYQHTWWSSANFNTPTSSPAFNYAFRREDDTIKLGVNFYFGAAPAPVSPAYPVKAVPPK